MKNTEIVGAEIEFQFGNLLSGWVESRLQLGLVLLQVARTLFLRNTRQQGVTRKTVFRNHDGREELVLECHPVEGFLYGLVNLFLRLVQIVGAVVFLFIGKCSVAVLKGESAFLLAKLSLPVDINLAIVGCKQSLHTMHLQSHMQQVVFGEMVVQGNESVVSGIGYEGDGGVACFLNLKIKVLRSNIGLFRGK